MNYYNKLPIWLYKNAAHGDYIFHGSASAKTTTIWSHVHFASWSCTGCFAKSASGSGQNSIFKSKTGPLWL